MREVSWVQKIEVEGEKRPVKREIRVNYIGKKLKWQFKRSDEERWNYDLEPSEIDWEEFMEKMDHRMQRRRGVDEQVMASFQKFHKEALVKLRSKKK